MLGLMVLLAAGLYLLVSIGVVRWARGYARDHGRSERRWGWLAALAMWLLVFWDWLPTVVVHQYHCITEAGFWVYKTVDQWKRENPGVMETLVANQGAPAGSKRDEDGHREIDTYYLNRRFNWVVIQQDISRVLPIIRVEQSVVDAATDEVLARYVDFGSGNSVRNTVGPPGPFKLWLHHPYCVGGRRNQDALWAFAKLFKGAER